MKKSVIFFVFCLLATGIFAQNIVPAVDITDINGNSFNTKDISNEGNPVIIIFWADWSQNSIDFLASLVQKYHGWQKDYKLKIFSVMVGPPIKIADLPKYVNDQKWPWIVLQDQAEYFKATMQCRTYPDTYIVNAKSQIVWHRNGVLYKDGISAMQTELKKLRTK